MIFDRKNKKQKSMEKILKFLNNLPNEEKEIIINKDIYNDNDFVVTIYDDHKCFLQICIYHCEGKRSKLLSTYDKNKNLFLNDIQCSIINKGFGTILMNEFIDYAKKNNFKMIYGYLSKIDISDHKDRLFAFYNKFNFSIDLSKESNSNKAYDIHLNL